MGWRIHRDTYTPRLREIRIDVPGLDKEVSVLQVTDLGGDEFGPKQAKLAALIAGQRFDTVVFTGDMAGDRGHDVAIWDLADLAKAHSRRVWYLPGNHDSVEVGPGLEARGVPPLPEDRAVALTDGDPSARDVALVYGRSSQTIATAEGHGRKLLVIASHTPPDANRLAAGLALGGGTHLYIAGHTHGGHDRLPLIGALWAPLSWAHEERAPARGTEVTFLPEWKAGRFVDGMYVRDGQRIFVSRGLESITAGFSRFLAQAEIVVYRFVPAPAAR
jgi:predicted MPP superfamily phosphohydrolase